MSRLSAFFALVSFAAAVLIELVFGFAGLFTHSIRVYPIECEGQVVFGTFCDGELTVPLNPSTFRAYPDRQSVIEWSTDGTSEYKRCTVQDFRNWQCTVPAANDLLLQKTMQDGQLTVSRFDSTMSPKTNVNSWDTIYVPVWDWLRFDLEYEMKLRQPQAD
ncbi:MAG: hypothetical protein ACLQU2_34020 [Candidatus Binataceae bacterium]